MKWLMKIFKVILADDEAEKILGKTLYKWVKTNKEIADVIGEVKSVYNLVMNPNNWLQALGRLTRQQRNNFFKELDELEKEVDKKNGKETVETEATVGMPSEPETQAFKTDDVQVDNKLRQMNDEMNGNGHWIDLSSSWIKRGMYKMIYKNKLLGTLSIETNTSDTIYAYPMVPYDVWVMMKEANGINGGGAGTVFWKYWLHQWLPSALRKKVKTDFANKKIGRDEYNIALEQVQVSARGFYTKLGSYNRRTGKDINSPLNLDWYKRQGGKGYKTGRKATYKSLYNNKYQKQYYKPAKNGFTTTVKQTKTVNRNTPKSSQKRTTSNNYTGNVFKGVKKAVNVAKNPMGAIKRTIKKNIRKDFKK